MRRRDPRQHPPLVAARPEHGTVLRTVSEQWPHDERLRDLWFSIMARFVAGTARVIRTACSGQAPGGADEETARQPA